MNSIFFFSLPFSRFLFQGILSHIESHQICRVSWLNRLLAKCSTAEDFEKGLEVYRVYQGRGVELPAETGTLLLKAGCRAEIPSRVLQLLKNKELEIIPTLGGIHYLMINFSLKNDSKSVMESFQVAQDLNLKPNQRSYHILIRECVDHDLIDEALNFAAQCKTAKIVPNRVTYNILMNGCRKANKPQAILQLRDEMNQHGIEINDTTVKFTALAHMMLGDVPQAVEAFLSFPELDTKMTEFANKFFEITEEDLPQQKKSVVQLFDALKANNVALPPPIEAKLRQLRSQTENL
jgi:pentatricopeptide repeat protein